MRFPNSIPRSIKEWGPVCARCGKEEYRINGYCTEYCEDIHEVEHELEKLGIDLQNLFNFANGNTYLLEIFNSMRARLRRIEDML